MVADIPTARQKTTRSSHLEDDMRQVEKSVSADEDKMDSDIFLDKESNGETLMVGGLSEEEVNDLDMLISGLKQKSTDMISEKDLKKIPDQIRAIEKRLVQISEMVLKFDSSFKTLVELVSLFQSKSKIWNHRLKVIENHLKQNNRS